MWLRPLLLLLPSIAWAINYKCQNDQVLVVQSFGNDTIRMHCQKLDLCGYQRLRCDYDEHQPQCGGLMNFVAHVTQSSATSPVEHTCCNLFNPRPPHMVTTHVGNDCFIYELPDGSSVAKPKEDHPDDTPLTVLKSAAEIPEHIDHVSGYRLRLFHLKNKSPPTLLVKGIERRLDGYRVTICRPRCTSFQTATQERAANAGQREGTAADGSEWKVISWSSWTSSSWTTWANSVGAQGERTRTRTGEVAPKDADRAGSASTGAGTGANNINVDVDANGNNNNKFGGENRGGFDRPTVNEEGPGHINITIHTAGQGSGAGSGAGNGSGNGNGATPNINVSANASNVIHNHVPDSGNDGTGKGGNGDQSTGTGKKGGKGDGEGGDVGTGTGTGTGGGKKGSKGGDNDPETDVGGEEGPEKANGQDKTAKKPGHLGENSLGDGEDDKSGGEDGKGGKKSSGSGTGKETGSGDGSGSKNGEDNSLENGPKSAKGGDGSSGKKDKTGAGAGGQGGQGGNPDGDNGDLHASTGDKDGTNAAAGGNGKNSGLGGAGKDQGTGPATGKNKTGPSGKGDGDDEDLLKGDGGKGGSGSGGDGGKGGSGDKKKPGAGDAGGKNGDKGDLHASTGDGTNASTGGEDNGPNGKDGSDGPDAKNGSKNGKAGKNGLEGEDKDKNGGKNGKNGAAGAGGKNGADENEIHAGPDGVDAAKGSGKKEGDEDGGKGGKKSGDGDEKDDKEPAVGLAGPGEINPDGGDNTEWAEGEDRLPKKPEDKKDGKDGSGKKDGESRSVPLKQERQAGGAVPAGEKSATGTGNGDGGPAGKSEEEAAKERLEHGEKDGGNGSEANFEEPEGADDKNKAAVAAGAAETGASDGAGGAIRTPDNRALKEKTDEEDGINEKASPNAEIQRAVESTEPMNPETPGAPANNGGTGTGTGSGEVHASPNDVNAGPSNTASDPGTGTVQNAQADPGPSSSAMLDAMKNMNCFPADAVVTTAYGKKRMDEVQVGDFVLVPSAGNVLKYERVEMFYHREESTRAQFVVIMTKSGKRMSLTPLHLLPFGQCEDVMRAMNSSEGLNELLGGSSFAHRAKIGDCVLSMTTDGELVADRITKVGRQYSTGIYSPMTVEGSLLVDGVLASCFSQLESHSVHKTVFDFLMYFRNLFGYEGHVHHEEQAIPSFITYVHDLSHYVLPFAKY